MKRGHYITIEEGELVLLDVGDETKRYAVGELPLDLDTLYAEALRHNMSPVLLAHQRAVTQWLLEERGRLWNLVLYLTVQLARATDKGDMNES